MFLAEGHFLLLKVICDVGTRTLYCIIPVVLHSIRFVYSTSRQHGIVRVKCIKYSRNVIIIEDSRNVIPSSFQPQTTTTFPLKLGIHVPH